MTTVLRFVRREEKSEMNAEHVVHEVRITENGNTYTAPYFVEYGIIHAQIGGRTMVAPIGSGGPEGTVRALLTGHLLQAGVRLRQGAVWAKRLESEKGTPG